MKNLNDEIKKCTQCRLAKTRINVLGGEGYLHAELMLIAQAPGAQEDREGRMFIGPSGKVLNDLLRMVHIDRKEIFPLQHPAAVLHDISIKNVMETNYRKMQVLYMSQLEKNGCAKGQD